MTGKIIKCHLPVILSVIAFVLNFFDGGRAREMLVFVQ